jgi:ABC-type lipoprotein release transport system permease subunit
MVFTFLNLVAVSGILVGLIEGSSVAYRNKYIGDFVVSPLATKKTIPDTESIVNILQNTPEIQAFSVRYANSGTLESNYNNRDASKRRELASGNILGIKPSQEVLVTGWNKDILEGEFLEDSEKMEIWLLLAILNRHDRIH